MAAAILVQQQYQIKGVDYSIDNVKLLVTSPQSGLEIVVHS